MTACVAGSRTGSALSLLMYWPQDRVKIVFQYFTSKGRLAVRLKVSAVGRPVFKLEDRWLRIEGWDFVTGFFDFRSPIFDACSSWEPVPSGSRTRRKLSASRRPCSRS